MKNEKSKSNKKPGCNSTFSPRQVVGLGELLWDVYPDGRYLGGAPANFAFHVHHTGHHGIIVSRVGSDQLGDELIEQINLNGLETRWIQQDTQQKTGTVKVTLDKNGIPSFKCTKQVAFDYIVCEPGWDSLFLDVDAVLYGTLAQRNEVSRTAIQHFISNANNAIKIFDINIRGWDDETQKIVEQSLPHADVVKTNLEELLLLRKSIGNEQDTVVEFITKVCTDYSCKLGVITLGEKGCFLVDEEQAVYSPGFKVPVVDTTGSGDAFLAGLTAKLLDGQELRQIAEFANGLGALVATRNGAAPGWTLSELRHFLVANRERIWDEELKEFA